LLNFTSLKYKIAIIFIVPAFGMLYFSSKYVSEKYDDLQNVKTLTETVLFAKYASQLIHELQKERGLSSGYVGEEYFKFTDTLKKQRLLTDKAYKQFLSSLPHSEISQNKIFSSKIKTVLTEVEKLSAYRIHIDLRDITFYKEVTFFSSTIHTLISSIPHLSSIFTPIEMSNTMESLFNLINMKEYAGIERAFLSNVFSEDTITAQQFKDIQKLIIKQKIHYDAFLNYTSVNNFQNYQKNIPFAITSELDTYRKTITSSTHNFKIDSMTWYNFATNRIDKLDLVLQDIMVNILDKSALIKYTSNQALLISALFWLVSLFALITLSFILRKLIYLEEKNVTDLHQQKKHYAALSSMSENIVYLDDKEALYNSLCRILVQVSEFKIAWIGIVDEKKEKILPFTANNITLHQLSKINFSTAPDQGQTIKAPERAFLEKNHVILTNGDLNLQKECNIVIDNSINAAGSFPIYDNEHVIAILSIYSENEFSFNLELIDLIEKMLKGLSFALSKIQEQHMQLLTKENLRIASYAFDAQEAMTITDIHANIIKVNQAFTDITGYSAKEVIGKNPRVLQSSQHDKLFYQQMWEDLNKNGRWKGEIYNQRKNGEVYPEILSITAIKDENDTPTHYIAQFLDISHIKNAQKEAEHKAQHDVLTGIANRAKLLEETERTFNRGRRSNTQHAFMFLDIDNFKHINDFYGHSIGDKLLVIIASRLNTFVRKEDIVARLGGDEFAIIVLDLNTNEHVAVKQVSLLAEKIQKGIAEPIIIDTQVFDITFSIGIKLFPDHEKTFQEVISHADIAMYQAKKLGRNQFAFFDHELDIESKRFIILEKDLKYAVQEQQFELYYQPKIDLLTNKILGVEALIRWNHPTKGILYPDSFLNVANDTRLIHDIGNFVIDEACKQLSLWTQKYKEKNYTIAINISAHQFQKNGFIDYIKESIAKYRTDASLLELEILEDALIKNMNDTVEKIKTLKALGIKFSIDDFGTGYSSMTYLQKFPIDTIKIDRSFIMELNNKSNQEIVKMIINFAKILNLHVIAEGVENEFALKFLQENHCDDYQGYYFSRPVQVQEIEKLLNEQ
jgi:diguanylate cyclase (GGDEF)-like protein/PAS domain S-box-containing protein